MASSAIKHVTIYFSIEFFTLQLFSQPYVTVAVSTNGIEDLLRSSKKKSHHSFLLTKNNSDKVVVSEHCTVLKPNLFGRKSVILTVLLAFVLYLTVMRLKLG
jgi:hypothetical protein